MDQRLFRDLAEKGGPWQTVPHVVRQALLSMNDALVKQREEIKLLRVEVEGKVSIADYEMGNTELRAALRRKTDLDYVNQQLDNKANVIDMYNALKAKANVVEVLQKLSEKAPLAALSCKASKTSVASALRKKCADLEDRLKADIYKLQLQVATAQGKVDALQGGGPWLESGLKETLCDMTETLADKAELQSLRTALHDTVQQLMSEKKAADTQLTKLTSSVHELQHHVLMASKSATRFDAVEAELRREVQSIREMLQQADYGLRRDQVALVIQQELGCHFSKVAEMQNRLHVLQQKMEELHDASDQEHCRAHIAELQEAIKCKADMKDLAAAKLGYQKELKALASKMTVPLCQQLQETTGALDKVEADLERLSQHLERKVSHGEVMTMMENKCDRSEVQALRDEVSSRNVALQILDLTRRLNELSNSYRIFTTEVAENHQAVVKQLAGKPDRDDLLRVAADITRDPPREPEWMAEVQECLAHYADHGTRLEALHKRLKTLSTTCEQVSEAVLDLRQHVQEKVTAGHLQNALQQQETSLIQWLEGQIVGDMQQMKTRMGDMDKMVQECQKQYEALGQPLQIHKEQVEDLKTRIGAVGHALDQFRRSIQEDLAESRKSVAAKMKKFEALEPSMAGQAGPSPEMVSMVTSLSEKVNTLQAMLGQHVDECSAAAASPPSPLFQDGDNGGHGESLLSPEEVNREIHRLDHQKVDREEMETLLNRKVDVQVFCERLAAKANNSELHQWAEDLNKEIHRRLQVKTDLRQFELLAKEVDKKVDADKLNLLLGRNFMTANSLVQSVTGPLAEDEGSLQLSWSSRGSQDGLS